MGVVFYSIHALMRGMVFKFTNTRALMGTVFWSTHALMRGLIYYHLLHEWMYILLTPQYAIHALMRGMVFNLTNKHWCYGTRY